MAHTSLILFAFVVAAAVPTQQTMDTRTWIALCSAAVAVTSFTCSIYIYFAQRRNSQTAEVGRLHELWWSEQFKDARRDVYAFVEEWEGNGRSITPIIESYREQLPALESERRTIGRIAFFFADLNAMIDEGLVSERFAYRIFGEAQFFWFSGFLLAIANEIEIRQRANADATGKTVRWVEEVRALERRFRNVQRRRG